MQVGNFSVNSFSIAGPLLITSKLFGDERGFFTERFRTDAFSQIGLPGFIQENYSRSQFGVMRGLHFQFDQPQGKLVTATRGKILDVAVDIRQHSPTFGRHLTVHLDGSKPEWFWVPEGFAHGFYVLSQEGADVFYKVNNVYNPKGEGAIKWNDSDLAIDWGVEGAGIEPILSEKDQGAPSFQDYKKSPVF